jgi:RNA polymerase sigma factor (sigma-70 family)
MLLALAAVGSVCAGILLPFLFLLALALGVLIAAWSGARLDLLGSEAVWYLVVALPLGGFMVSTAGLGAWHGGSRGRWLWWITGLALLAAGSVLVPGSAGERAGPHFTAATCIVGFGLWLLLTCGWAGVRVIQGVLGGLVRLAERSAVLVSLLCLVGSGAIVAWMAVLLAFGATVRAELEQSFRRSPISSQLSLPPPDEREPVVPPLFEHEESGSALLLGLSADPAPEVPEVEGLQELQELQALGEADTARQCLEQLDEGLRRTAERIAGRYVRGADAQDVVQESLFRACVGRTPPAEFAPYFLQAVRNRAISWYRRGARRCSLDDLPEPSCELDLEAPARMRVLNDAMCRLHPDDQRILGLRYYDALSGEEIARRMGMTPVAARKRSSRAVAKLRDEVRRICPE